jgi:hypothetical protein
MLCSTEYCTCSIHMTLCITVLYSIATVRIDMVMSSLLLRTYCLYSYSMDKLTDELSVVGAFPPGSCPQD